METHSSILAWEIPWTEESDGLQSMGSQELDTTKQLKHQQAHKPKKKEKEKERDQEKCNPIIKLKNQVNFYKLII